MSGPDLPPPSGPPVVPAGGGDPRRPDDPPPADDPYATPSAPPPGWEAPPSAQDQLYLEGWRRLSPRMLIVHPVRTLISLAIPLLLVTFGLGSQNNQYLVYAVGGALIAVVAGVMTWLITRYRFTEEQLQLRTGLLSRRVLTAPLDRIRSVDIESTPIHRILGLSKVKVGTGVDSSQIELDGLTAEQAATLRVDLLRRSKEVPTPGEPGTDTTAPDQSTGHVPAGDVADDGAAAPAAAEAPEQELARINWSWLRFAPFSLSSLVVVAGAVGVLFQFGDNVPVNEEAAARGAWTWVVGQAVLVLVGLLAAVVLVGWVVVSTTSYILNWWNLRLVREGNGNIRTTRGLLTTRSQTLERAKVRGVQMGEPFLLRFVRGAELTALATGVGLGGTTKVLPPAPRAVVQSVGHELIEEDGPLTMVLTGHGPRARRRIHVSRQWGTLILTALLGVLVWLLELWIFAGWPWWLPLAVLGGLGLLNAVVAESAWRNLGHGLTDGHLVVQTGAFLRTREALERAGIIGWVLHQNFFQRRLGLADLTATTAAGGEQVVAPNIPVELGVDLADRATPGMLDDLLASPGSGPDSPWVGRGVR